MGGERKRDYVTKSVGSSFPNCQNFVRISPYLKFLILIIISSSHAISSSFFPISFINPLSFFSFPPNFPFLFFFFFLPLLSLIYINIMSLLSSDQPRFHVLAVDDSLVDRKLIERLLKTSSFNGNSLFFLLLLLFTTTLTDFYICSIFSFYLLIWVHP